jgi:probable HAF family extracellular repeat protein
LTAKISTLGPLKGGNFSQANAVNDAGQVVGTCGLKDADGKPLWLRAVLWSHGQTTDLGLLEGGTSSEAFGINNKGQAVGRGNVADGSIHAFLWDGTLHEIGTLGGSHSEAWAINDAGKVVGMSTTADEVNHAFLWDGTMRDLGTLGGIRSFAYDINEAGDVVGTAEDKSGHLHAVMWADGGPPIDLGTLGGTGSLATGTNNSGMVVGTSFTKDDKTQHPFLWVGNVMSDLHTLKKTWGIPSRINDGGVVVGFVCPAEGASCDHDGDKGAIWQNGQITDLNDLLSSKAKRKWLIQAAYDISNDGVIVGIGTVNPGRSGAVQRGFVLSTGGGARTTQPKPTAAATETPAPPKEPPREFPHGDDFFLRDRIVPLDRGTLTPIGTYGDFKLYAKSADTPFAALYIPVSQDVASGVIRYLPEQLDRRGDPCPADTPAPFQQVKKGDSDLYVFAGADPDLGGDDFGQPTTVTSGDKQYSFYRQLGSGAPDELFLQTENGFQRYVPLPKDGTPPQLAEPASFGGQTFRLTETISDPSKLPDGLKRVGCAGPFTVRAPLGKDASPFSTLYASVGGPTLVFTVSNETATTLGTALTRQLRGGTSLVALANGRLDGFAPGVGTVGSLPNAMPTDLTRALANREGFLQVRWYPRRRAQPAISNPRVSRLACFARFGCAGDASRGKGIAAVV